MEYIGRWGEEEPTKMKTRTHALVALVALGTACGRPPQEAGVAADQAGPPELTVSAAQATAGKPLIHVWKSPT